MPVDRQPDCVSVPCEGESLSPHAHRPDYVIDHETGCWVWQKTLNAAGYGTGSFTGAGLSTRYAHRAYYTAAYGPIAEGTHLHHRCENPPCVNPAHMEVTVHALHLAYHKQEISSLSWDDVHAIRDAVKRGVRQQDLRRQYGIAQPTLSDIITNTTWKDPAYIRGRPVICAECGEEFTAQRANARFCSERHRIRFIARAGWRRRNGLEARDAA